MQLEAVQVTQFGPRLVGAADALPGWRHDLVEITGPQVLALSGERYHPIVRETGDPGDSVPRTMFSLSERKLQRADDYEVDAYVRIAVLLRSKIVAWANVAV